MKRKNVLFSAAGAAAGVYALKKLSDFYKTKIESINKVKALDEHIYLMDYNRDYNLDGILNKGISNTGELLAFVSDSVLFGGKLLKIGSGSFACSTFNAFTDSGEHIFARNFDYKKAPCMVVWTHPKNAYASVAVADCNFMLFGDVRKPKHTMDNLQTLLAPYCCMDGINEKGLAIGVLELKAKATYQDTGKKSICTTVAIRAVLDKCSTVDEAVELLKSYDMHDALFCCYHYHIADASGKSVVVEYVNNEMQLFYPEQSLYGCSAVTNFFLSADGDNKKGFGYDRSTSMKARLRENKGVLSESEAMELLNKVHLDYKHEIYPWQVITLWSAVYNCNQASLNICAGLNYSNGYSFNVNKPCTVHKEAAV